MSDVDFLYVGLDNEFFSDIDVSINISGRRGL